MESLTFPSSDELVIRRQLSFDFTIPEGLHEMTGSDPGLPTYYVPLSAIPRRPPLIGFDLHDGNGGALSLLMRSESNIIDVALLRALAGDAAGAHLLAELERIVREPSVVNATSAYYRAFYGSDGESQSAGRPLDPALRQLANDLVSQTVLWAPVTGRPGQRRIVKLGYDIRRELTPLLFERASYGWLSFKVAFELPSSGNASSYHLDIAAPAPLRVTGALIRFYAPSPSQDERLGDERPFGPISADEEALREVLKPVERAEERHATFYITGEHEERAAAWIKVLVEKDGYIRGAFVASLVITAALAAFAIAGMKHILNHSTDAVTTLLFLPVLLNYIVIRSSEHELGKNFLSGLRKLTTTSSLLPVVAAAGIVVAGRNHTHTLSVVWLVLVILSSLITAALLVSSVIPFRHKPNYYSNRDWYPRLLRRIQGHQ